MEKATYKISVAGLKRELPLCPLNEQLDIAAFIIFGDVELTVASAKALLEKCPEFDFIVTPEAKGIPLAYEMSRQSEKPYIVIRKAKKLYMQEPVCVQVRSITTDAVQTLVLDRPEGERLSGKRVLILDDVISTGESLYAVRRLVEKFHGTVVGQAAILAEGDAAERKDLIFLEKLPLFQNDR